MREETANVESIGQQASVSRLHWFCAHTYPQKESTVLQSLNALQIHALCPRVHSNSSFPQWLFPQYCFARFDPTVALMSVTNARGVDRVISMCNRPVIVPDQVIEEIAARTDGGTGYVIIKPFICGEPIKIKDGPFVDLNGMFSEMAGDRCVVLLQMLGRTMKYTCSREMVESVWGPSMRPRP